MIHTQEGPSYISVANLKRIALFVQINVIRSQLFEIGSRDPGHAHLGYGPHAGEAVLSVPNMKWIDQFVQKLLTGSQN